MICSKCGALISDSAKFCTECGCKIDIPSVIGENNAVTEIMPETADIVTEEVMKADEAVAEINSAISENEAEVVANDMESFDNAEISTENAESVADSFMINEKEIVNSAETTDNVVNAAIVGDLVADVIADEIPENAGGYESVVVPENAGVSENVVVPENTGVPENIGVPENTGVIENPEVPDLFAQPVAFEQNQYADEQTQPMNDMQNHYADDQVPAMNDMQNQYADEQIQPMNDMQNQHVDEQIQPMNDMQNQYPDIQEQYMNGQVPYEQNSDANGDNQGMSGQDGMTQNQMAQSTGKKKKKRGFGIRLVTILLGIITAACLIGFMVYSSALKTLSPDCVTEIMDAIPLEKIEVGSMIKGIELEGFDTTDIADDATVAQVAYRLIPEKNREKYHISEEQIDEILSDEKISGRIKDIVSNNIDDYIANIGDEESFSIKKKDVLRIVEKSRADIKDITGYTITENDMEIIEDKLDEANLEKIELPRLEEQVPEKLAFVIEGLTSWGKWAVLGITGLFALLILLCNINQIRFGFRAISLVMIIDGFILSAAALVEKIGIFAVENHMNFGIDKKIIKPVLGTFANNLLLLSAIVLAAGVALMIVVVIWKCVANAVERKRERA